RSNPSRGIRSRIACGVISNAGRQRRRREPFSTVRSLPRRPIPHQHAHRRFGYHSLRPHIELEIQPEEVTRITNMSHGLNEIACSRASVRLRTLRNKPVILSLGSNSSSLVCMRGYTATESSYFVTPVDFQGSILQVVARRSPEA